MAERDDERLDRIRREAEAASALADRVAAQAQADLARSRQALVELQRRHDRVAAELAEMRASTAWRVTAPVRRGLTAAPFLHRPLTVAVKAVWWSATFQWPARLRARRAFLEARAETERVRAAGRLVEKPGRAERDNSAPEGRTETVDVIVCVHNALADVQACLASLSVTPQPWRLIIVDDGSASETETFLADFAKAHGATLIRNDQARGYTFAANQGMRASTAPWLVLLNSDTIVTEGWLERMIGHAAADAQVGMVGPMSNTASWQSAPKMVERGDWAENPLQPGMTVADMGALVAGASAGQAMPLPFLNGFCMLLRKAMLDDIGLFDEETFGAGYGEENDLSIRARNAGWRLVVASDAYVFHAQSKSYSHERRKMLAERAGQRLAAKHDAERDIERPVAFCRDNLGMAATRARVAAALERDRLAREGRERWEGLKVAFVLPIDREGGGGNVVRQEVHALGRMGVDWRIVNLEHNRADFEESYPDLAHRTRFVAGREEALRLLEDPAEAYDAAVATYFPTTLWLPRKGLRLGYYIQDYEPLFFEEGDPQREIAVHSYVAHEDFGLFTKSRWNAETVQKSGAPRPAVIGPSVDIDLFRPRPHPYDARGGGPVRLCAMIRPTSERRGPKRTMQVLSRLRQKFGDRIEIAVFGCDDHYLAQYDEYPLGPAVNYQRMDRAEMAWLMERCDVFLDFSDYQAMGLTALEAMAAGCAAVVPVHGGAPDFARHEHNALVIDTLDIDECMAAAERLITDPPLLSRLRHQGALDACEYAPDPAAFRMMEALFGSGRKR